jgi:predicted RNase H-like HicB family nuclease
MKLEVELYKDAEMGQWGYSVPALSIVGTGCETRDEAEDEAMGAIRFALETSEDDRLPGSVVVEYEVTLIRSPQAS